MQLGPSPDRSYEALVPLGWNERVRSLFEEVRTPGAVPGRVVRVERSSCVVATTAGDVIAHRRPLPSVGDWVALPPGVAGRSGRDISGAVPRWSALSRQDPHGDRPQTLAANVDVVLVAAPADRLSVARVERELVLAWDSGTRPVVVVTKSDLAEDDLMATLAARLVGADLLATSTRTGAGLEQVSARLRPNLTGVILGPSGAGKSSLINALLDDERLAVGDVRAGDQRGRHTTTSRQLVVLPTGGVLIDTPGLRAVGLWEADAGIGAAFADIEGLAAGCRFADCVHDREPGCAVLAAVADGSLSAERFQSYEKLRRESASQVTRTDFQTRAKEAAVSRARTKSTRARLAEDDENHEDD